MDTLGDSYILIPQDFGMIHFNPSGFRYDPDFGMIPIKDLYAP